MEKDHKHKEKRRGLEWGVLKIIESMKSKKKGDKKKKKERKVDVGKWEHGVLNKAERSTIK